MDDFALRLSAFPGNSKQLFATLGHQPAIPCDGEATMRQIDTITGMVQFQVLAA